jgi:hypothetical protein
MAEHWCECDPHGDGYCDRPCCKPKPVRPPKPSPEDMAKAIEALRMLASRTRSVEVMERLARVASWIEGESAR